MKKLLIGILVVGLAAVLFGIGCSTLKSSSGNSTYSADVIIVGAGGAGMTAAIHAAEKGASVIILEKSSVVGGNTISAGTGFNALKDGSQTDIDAFIASQTNALAKPELVEALVINSAPTLTWLKTGLGLNLATGATDRQYRLADGTLFVQTLIPKLYTTLKNKQINVLLNMRATTLIQEDGRVTGVKATDAKGNELTFNGNAVVLATGGFGENYDLVHTVNPTYKDVFTSAEIAPTTGDGLVMAQASPFNAAVVDLGELQMDSFVELTTRANINFAIITSDISFILVNSDVKRFVNEKSAGESVLEQPGYYAYFIFDARAMATLEAQAEAQPNLPNTLMAFYEHGLLSEGTTVKEVAKGLGIDEDKFQTTVDEWNALCDSGGTGDAFGRTACMYPLETAPYYGVKFSLGVHYCRGGLKINTDTQVIDTSNQVIPGLYAAGEVTGGVQGTRRAPGSGIADTLVFGRLAGINAAAHALEQGELPLNIPSDANQGPAAKGNFVDGVYEGTGVGRNGDIKVKVTVVDKSITKIEVVPLNPETPTMFMAVENNLIPAIILKQSLKVDVATGATFSSNGVLDAVAEALRISR